MMSTVSLIHFRVLLIICLRPCSSLTFLMGSEYNPKNEEFYKQVSTRRNNPAPKILEETDFAGPMERVQLLDYDRGTKAQFYPRATSNLSDSSISNSEDGDFIMTGESLLEPFRSEPVRTRESDVVVGINKNKMDGSVRVISNLLSYYTSQLMNKFKGTDKNVINQKDDITWTKIEPMRKEPIQLHGSDKIKRLLSLFSIVKFNNVECESNGARGICLHHSECERLKGTFTTTCAQQHGVCCEAIGNPSLEERTCGGYSSETSTIFLREGTPGFSTTPSVCTLNLNKAEPTVTQLRLEFLTFQLREPSNGTCLHDRLVITGQNVNSAVPDICGYNTGHHIYVDVDDSSGPYQINVVTVGDYYQRDFKIKIKQLTRNDEQSSPKHCLQYFTEPLGVLESFNYQKIAYEKDSEIVTGYFNNLNYAICIKKLTGYCSISYENNEWENSTQPTFQLINVDEDGDLQLNPRQAGAETFACPNDYLIVGGMRLCGEKFNDGSVGSDLTKNYPVTDTSNGPFMISVRTDGSDTGRGFSLTYRQIPCSS